MKPMAQKIKKDTARPQLKAIEGYKDRPRPVMQNIDYYKNNPLIHRDRRLGQSSSEWVRSFACEDLKPLIVCRGPIRKEAMDVYEEMGITHYGILLSEKDSIVYPNALAPELRKLTDSTRVHRVPDYSGASKDERVERINQIIQTARDNGYDSVFAGYGFMAEDEEFVAAIEKAGLKFIGPCAATQASAGKKDEAKRTALSVDVSVTPGINNVTARTLLKKHPGREQLLALVKAEGLACDEKVLKDKKVSLEALADHILFASYAKGIDLFSIEELCTQVQADVAEMFKNNPQSRIRLKAIGGGGGKGQRILGASLLTAKNASDAQIAKAAADARHGREISEVRPPASATTRTSSSSSTSSRPGTMKSSSLATASGASPSAGATVQCSCTSRSCWRSPPPRRGWRLPSRRPRPKAGRPKPGFWRVI
jgi:hypothetical protein